MVSWNGLREADRNGVDESELTPSPRRLGAQPASAVLDLGDLRGCRGSNPATEPNSGRTCRVVSWDLRGQLLWQTASAAWLET